MNIAVLLSGGVDSSVVVHLLCEQGYRPSLFYIKIGRDDADYMDCSAEEDMEMASAIARRYGLSLEVVDLHREYWDQVAAYAIPRSGCGKLRALGSCKSLLQICHCAADILHRHL